MTIRIALAALLLCLTLPAWSAGRITVAAAADLKFAMEDIVAAFRQSHPGDTVDVVYGSSGKFYTQVQQGAPYDLFFSADIAYPELLAKNGLAASAVKPYGLGRLVLWSPSRTPGKLTLTALADPAIRKIAIANPRHAPYGKRAEEALRTAGVWDKIEARLIMGENIAQAAQYVQSGNADVGIIALALALNKELAVKGGYVLIDDKLHTPLEQGFIVTKRAAANPLAARFADFMVTAQARKIMVRYGFALPGEGK